MKIKIKNEFKNFMNSTPKQKADLEAQIVQDGKILQPLIVGRYTDNGKTYKFLIDGHHRLEIAKKHKLRYEVAEPIDFANEQDVYT